MSQPKIIPDNLSKEQHSLQKSQKQQQQQLQVYNYPIITSSKKLTYNSNQYVQNRSSNITTICKNNTSSNSTDSSKINFSSNHFTNNTNSSTCNATNNQSNDSCNDKRYHQNYLHNQHHSYYPYNHQKSNQTFRLFTFMNSKQQSFDERKFPIDFQLYSQKPYYYLNQNIQNQNKRNKVNNIQQYDPKKIVQMIQESRKKRQSYLSQIQLKPNKNNHLSISNLSNTHKNQRKSKTPKAKQNKKINIKQSHSITPKIMRTNSQINDQIKLKTIQVNNQGKNCFISSISPYAKSKSPLSDNYHNKLFRAKSSLGDFKKSTKQPLNQRLIDKSTRNSVCTIEYQENKTQNNKKNKSKKEKSITQIKNSFYKQKQSLKINNESMQKLLKKKKQLEKELLNINSSLLMKKKIKQKQNEKPITGRVKKRAY